VHLASATHPLKKEAFFGSAATRRRFAVTRHVAQQQSGIMLPHSKEWIVFLKLRLVAEARCTQNQALKLENPYPQISQIAQIKKNKKQEQPV
jgi:hypothetical protein